MTMRLLAPRMGSRAAAGALPATRLARLAGIAMIQIKAGAGPAGDGAARRARARQPLRWPPVAALMLINVRDRHQR